MWKDSYQIGVELIDQQHKELFLMVEQLVRATEEETVGFDRKEDCKKAIAFMKQYVVIHFRAEEAYMQAIGYCDLEEHRQLHRRFNQDLLGYDQKLLATDFANGAVKEFVGMLMTWLIYHVADADQKFGKNQAITRESPVGVGDISVCLQCFVQSIGETLEKMSDVSCSDLVTKNAQEEQELTELSIELGVTGELKGSVVYRFSNKFALEMMKIMTFMEMTELDEMVCSAMAEISNIMSGGAMTMLAEQNCVCDITPPVLTLGKSKGQKELKSKILIQSPIGEIIFGTTF